MSTYTAVATITTQADWENAAKWDLGSGYPGAGDTVKTDSYVVTIAGVDRTCTLFQASSTGYFVVAEARTITGNIDNISSGTGGAFRCTHTTGTVTIKGNITNNSGTQNSKCVDNQSTGTLTIEGTVTGGPASGAHGLVLTGTGTVNVTGTGTVITGGSNSGAYGVNVAAAGTLNVTGNVVAGTGLAIYAGAASCSVSVGGTVTGGASNNVTGITTNATCAIAVSGSVIAGAGGQGIVTSHAATLSVSGTGTVVTGVGGHGIQHNSTGNCTITGNVVGSDAAGKCGVYNHTSGTVAVTGSATGGAFTSGYGIWNASSGTVTVSDSATGGTGSGAYGVYNASTGSVTVGTAVGNNYGPGGGTIAVPGVYGLNIAGQVTRVKKTQAGAYGQAPTGGAVTMLSDSTNESDWLNSAGGTIALVLSTGGGAVKIAPMPGGVGG